MDSPLERARQSGSFRVAIDLDNFDIPFGRTDDGLLSWSLQRSFDLIFNPLGTILTKIAIGCNFGRSDDGG